MKRCEVCKERPRRHHSEAWSELCDECYDSFHARAGHEGSVVWAARRARRYERARQAEEEVMEGYAPTSCYSMLGAEQKIAAVTAELAGALEREEALEGRCAALISQRALNLDEIERLTALIERDKTGMAAALGEVRKIAKGYGWIPAGEFGSYTAAGCGEGEELTEEVLREEVGRCLDEIRAIAVRALAESGDRVNAAFVLERDRLHAALKRVAEMEARVADVWREGYEAAMQTSGFGDDPEWDDEGVNPYRVRP